MQQLPLGFAPDRRIFTVSELTTQVRELLEDRFADVWVAGEISNTRAAPSGHYYFTLKDRDAQLRCVCFRQNALYLKLKPQDGLAALVRGRVSVYEVRGEYQLYVEYLEPQGYGALQLAFEQLKRKLAAEGLFDEERKRPLPEFPRRIGIVTSPRGAVISDMLRILERRFEGLQILVYPVLVQGDGAADDIRKALRHFSDTRCVDVVIVGRGGGSLEDLWAFNEESVARAIAECPIPVISAVGHQTDFTIADFVADLRAPTPSAAAELVIRQKSEFVEMISSIEERLLQAVRYRLAITGRRLLETSVDRATASLRRRLGALWQRADEREFQLRQAVVRRLRTAEARYRDARQSLVVLDLRVRLAQTRAQLEGRRERLMPLMAWRLEASRSKLESLDRQMRQLSPLAILERGYAIVEASDGAIIRSSEQTAPGDSLGVRLHEGRLRVRVEDRRSD